MDTPVPTLDQLRTMCNRVLEALTSRRQHLARLEKEAALTRNDIVNLQGALAAFQVACGEKHDPTLAAMDINIWTDSTPS